MTNPRLIQNFSGAQALLIAPPGTATEVLAGTLWKLGLTVASVVPAGDAPWLDVESLAVNEHNRRRLLEERIARHEERRRGRRHVVKAILRLMQEHGLDDDAAYEALRREAMRARQPLEAYCETLIRARPSPVAPTVAPRLARS